MKYAKIENNIVTQIQPNNDAGFILVDDYVMAGMAYINDEFIILNSFETIVDGTVVFNCESCRAERVEEIRKQRDEALFNRFDGIMLGYERDNNTSMTADCESLRQSLKDAPVNATTALSSLTDYDDIQAVTLQSVLIVPTSLQDLVNEYFNNL